MFVVKCELARELGAPRRKGLCGVVRNRGLLSATLSRKVAGLTRARRGHHLSGAAAGAYCLSVMGPQDTCARSSLAARGIENRVSFSWARCMEQRTSPCIMLRSTACVQPALPGLVDVLYCESRGHGVIAPDRVLWRRRGGRVFCGGAGAGHVQRESPESPGVHAVRTADGRRR